MRKRGHPSLRIGAQQHRAVMEAQNKCQRFPTRTDTSWPLGSSYLLVPPPSGWHVPASSDPSPLPTPSCILGAPPCRRVLSWYHSLQIPGSQGTCQTCLTAWPAPKTGASRMNTKPDLGRMLGAAGR